MSDCLQPHELQHARPPCPTPTPGAYPNSCPLSRWCHPTISSFVSPSPPALSIRVFSYESALCTRWPKYWSFSFNIPSETLNKELIFHWGKKKTFIKNNRNPKPGCKINHQVKQYSEFWKLGLQCAMVRRIKKQKKTGEI